MIVEVVGMPQAAQMLRLIADFASQRLDQKQLLEGVRKECLLLENEIRRFDDEHAKGD